MDQDELSVLCITLGEQLRTILLFLNTPIVYLKCSLCIGNKTDRIHEPVANQQC